MAIRQSVTEHEGNKYLRRIYSFVEKQWITVDIYCVIDAWAIKCPAQQHAIKKLLQPGERGKGDLIADLKGAMAALNRALDFAERDLELEKLTKMADNCPKFEEKRKPSGFLCNKRPNGPDTACCIDYNIEGKFDCGCICHVTRTGPSI